MNTINIYDAKTNLSSLIAKALKGEDIIIAKAGKPLVRLMPVEKKKKPRKFGQLKGKIWMAKDFDELPEDFMKYFS